MDDGASGGYLSCLMCDAEIPVSGENVGEEVYCSFCQSSMKLKKGAKDDDLYLEEDS